MSIRTILAAAALAASAGAASAQSIAEIASGDDRFDTLVAAVTAAGLAETLSGPGTFTVFAPTDAAFERFPDGAVAGLLEPEARETLTQILTYHVVGSEIPAASIPAGRTAVQPLFGQANFCVTNEDGVTIADGAGQLANVVATDIEADNGVIHVVDTVLIPGPNPDCH